MGTLEGKTVVITGGADGLGRAWCEAFLLDGAKVVVADIKEEKMAEVAALGALTIRTDVTDADQVARMVEFAARDPHLPLSIPTASPSRSLAPDSGPLPTGGVHGEIGCAVQQRGCRFRDAHRGYSPTAV